MIYCETCGKELTQEQILKAKQSNKIPKYCSTTCWGKRKREYKYDHEFLNILTSFGAYFIGFFVADGHYSKKGGVHIYSSDEELILQFASKTNYKKKINPNFRKNLKFKHVKPEFVLSYFGDIPKSIKKMGYNPGPKTGKEFIPDCITEELFPHFLRGFFDGDGGFTRTKGYGYLHFMLCNSSKKILNQIYKRLKNLNIIKNRPEIYKDTLDTNVKRTIPLYSLSFGHADSIRISDFMYKDADIKLHRKYRIYEDAKKLELSLKSWRGHTCNFKNCKQEATVKGYCKKHYDYRYSKEYLKKNRERIREYQRQYTATHREKINERRRRWYAENREEILEQVKEYRTKNPDKMREIKRRFRQNHKEEINEYKKEYRKQNPEMHKEMDRERYARDRDKILERQKGYYKEKQKDKLAYAEAYRKAHREEIRRKDRERYRLKKERLAAEKASRERENEQANA